MQDSIELIENKIYIIRNKKVLLDRDLAMLYGVTTGRLNEQVRRNINRFPGDFMFQLTKEEFSNLRSQIVTSIQENGLGKPDLISQFAISSSKHGGRRLLPYAFTEQGIAMLSSVLNSEQAIQVNIQIVRTFTKLRQMILDNKELREKLEELEQKYDQQFVEIFTAIKLLLSPPTEPPGKIGFRSD